MLLISGLGGRDAASTAKIAAVLNRAERPTSSSNLIARPDCEPGARVRTVPPSAGWPGLLDFIGCADCDDPSVFHAAPSARDSPRTSPAPPRQYTTATDCLGAQGLPNGPSAIFLSP